MTDETEKQENGTEQGGLIDPVVMWLMPESAPKDGSLFLADMGLPWPCLVCWNKYQEEWVYPNHQINIVGGEHDPYFDTEYGKSSELKQWAKMPELP